MEKLLKELHNLPESSRRGLLGENLAAIAAETLDDRKDQFLIQIALDSRENKKRDSPL